MFQERRLYRRRSEPAAFKFHPLDHQDTGQEEILHRRFELHLPARDGEGIEDPHREKRRRVDRGRISRTRPFGMGIHGQQDQGSGCDVVLSNVVGDSVVAFYREYKNQGLTHDKLPICATVTSEIEIAAMGPEYAVGSYTSFPISRPSTPTATSVVERYRAFVKDPKAVTHHALESSYFQVFLWKAAVEKAAEMTPTAIREAVEGAGVRRSERSCEDRSR